MLKEPTLKDFAINYIDDLIGDKEILMQGLNDLLTHLFEKGDLKGRKIAMDTLSKLYLKPTKHGIEA